MNESDVTLVISAAVTLEMISEKQADLLKEELFMFPGMNPLNIMMRRGMISADQSQTLTKILSGEIPLPASKTVADPLSDIELEFDKYKVHDSVESQKNIAEPSFKKIQSPFEVPSVKTSPAAENFISSPVRNVTENRVSAAQDISASQSKLQALKDELTAWKRDAKPLEQPSEIKARPAIKQFVNNITDQFHKSESIKSTLPLAATYPSAWENLQFPSEGPKVVAVGPNASLQDYLNAARLAGCSDLHFSVGRKPFVRWQGEIFFLDTNELSKEQTEQLLFSVLTPDQVRLAKENLQLDFAFEIDGLGRHRANIYKQRLGWDGAFRLVSQYSPPIDTFGSAGVLSKLTQYHQGLILVTGSAGCGKTTTVASMLNYINKNRSDHIVTVEDPVEYVITPDQCQVTQRQVGPHTESFSNALRAALRQDPDIIMVGELRDLETTSIAISAAETGHLVLGTLHTSSAIRTVARILDVYPPIQRAQICLMIAESLRGIISQQLVPRKDRCGRIAAMEILLFTSGVAQIIKEGKTHQLLSQMQAGRKLGMKTMDDALLELVESDIISGEDGYIRAENKMMFQPHLNRK